MGNRLMAHHIIGYPTIEKSAQIIEDYIAAGTEILELQIPFSHPTADGSVLTEANHIALENGATIEFCFRFLEDLHSKYPTQRIILMSYLNKIYGFGIANFTNRLRSTGVQHIIVPDMPIDSPEAIKIAETIQIVPVIASNISEKRLENQLLLQPDYVYCVADFKVTGSAFSLNENVAALLEKVRSKSPKTAIGLGFGIAESAHVAACLEYADFAIVGSALKLAIDAKAHKEKIAELVG